MVSKITQLVVFACFATVAYCASCTNPQVTVNSFSTRDATIVSQIGYVGEFTLDCSNSESPSLFAEFDGKISPVARVGENKYQISWNEEIKKSRGKDFNIRLFDDEGFANIRKAQRSGEDLQSVKALTEIVVSHPGAYKGPWVNSELVASAVIGFIAYFACTTKNKILS